MKADRSRDGADFTLLFESFAMILVREMPVNKVSHVVKIDDNKVLRMMHHTFKDLKIIIYVLTSKLDYSKVGLPT